MTQYTDPKTGLFEGASLGDPGTGTAWDLLMNAAMRGHSALMQPTALAIEDTPSTTANGRTVLVGTGSGAFATHDGKIARYTTTGGLNAWEFLAPGEGWRFFIVATGFTYRYSGSAWVFESGSGITGDRPATGVTGACYFDTTTGIPNWYTGAAWVDATGASV